MEALHIPEQKFTVEEVEEIIKDYDFVPVVRCKDCAHWEKSFECWFKGSKHYHCCQLDTCTDENFYCADGERRE
jgi:hypothetical protein